MTTKIIILGFVLITCSQSLAQKNPDYICKDCGNFDLAKISFNENVSDLISKTEVWKTAIVNDNNEEKDINELTKKDLVKLYKYHFSNQQNKILGEKPFNYNNQFSFNNLILLADANNRIYAYESTIFYKGNYSDIKNFITYLIQKNENLNFKQNKMLGDLSVYQWESEKGIMQFVCDNKEGTEEQTINGKTTKIKSTYVKLNYYDKAFINNSVNKMVEKDVNFVIFNEKHYRSK